MVGLITAKKSYYYLKVLLKKKEDGKNEKLQDYCYW